MRVVLLGPPGAGKGTQAGRLADGLGVPVISTGDIFRRNADEGTELGRVAEGYMSRGELVPDDVVVAMVAEALEGAGQGFVLDGFPRNIAQAEALERRLEEMGLPLDLVLAFLIDDDEVVRRIAGRRVCLSCQTPYHAESSLPKRAGVCDACGGRVVQRDDDREEVVRRRLEVYHASTKPLIEFYGARGLLREVDGSGPQDEVAARVDEAVGRASSTASPGLSDR
jgi:adenylate kinase